MQTHGFAILITDTDQRIGYLNAIGTQFVSMFGSVSWCYELPVPSKAPGWGPPRWGELVLRQNNTIIDNIQ